MRAAKKHAIHIDWTLEGIPYISSFKIDILRGNIVTHKLGRAYDINIGVRSVVNEVQRIAVHLVAEAQIRGDIMRGCVVRLLYSVLADKSDPEDRSLVLLTVDERGDIVMKSVNSKGELRRSLKESDS